LARKIIFDKPPRAILLATEINVMRRTIKRKVTIVTTTTWTVQWTAGVEEAGAADPTVAAAPVSEPPLPAPEPQDTEIKSATEKEARDEVKAENENNQPPSDGSSA
jgi:hypothetical protein